MTECKDVAIVIKRFAEGAAFWGKHGIARVVT